MTQIGHLAPLDPPEPGRVQVLRASLFGGWLVCIWRRDADFGLRFDATLTAPDGREVYSMLFAATRDRAIESLAGFMAFAVDRSQRWIEQTLIALLDLASPGSEAT